MPASTARTCLRSDADSVHEQNRDQASARERGCDMTVTLAAPHVEKFVIEGGQPLSGTVVPAGNKNAALPLLAASLLTDDEVVLHNVPHIRDVEAMVALLEGLGVESEWRDEHTIALRAREVATTEVDPRLADRIRASFLVAGPLLARCGDALLPPPGGDVIGRRRLDPHLDAFRAMGAEHSLNGVITLTAPSNGLRAGEKIAIRIAASCQRVTRCPPFFS